MSDFLIGYWIGSTITAIIVWLNMRRKMDNLKERIMDVVAIIEAARMMCRKIDKAMKLRDWSLVDPTTAKWISEFGKGDE